LPGKDVAALGAGETVLMPLLLESGDTHSVDWLSTFSADGSPSLVIVLLTIRQSLVFKELSVREGLAALGAGEVVSVPVLVECSDGSSVDDGLVTLCTGVSEQLVVMLEAIGVLILFKELSVREGLVEDSTAEAIFMEVLVESLQIASLDHFSAARASWQERAPVTAETVGLAVPVEKLFRPDLLFAAGTREALEVIKRAQCLQCVTIDLLSARSTSG